MGSPDEPVLEGKPRDIAVEALADAMAARQSLDVPTVDMIGRAGTLVDALLDTTPRRIIVLLEGSQEDALILATAVRKAQSATSTAESLQVHTGHLMIAGETISHMCDLRAIDDKV